MIWNAVERFGSSFFLFVSNLVLARLLSPDDFGCIGMLLVFISISDAIVDGGFGSALIQKKNPTATDYSTVFYWNLGLSFVLYATLFLTAPLIADFYAIPLLSDILKIQGIILIFNAFVLIQQNILKKQIAFGKIAKINLTAIIIGTCIGIILAFLDFGVWSLVAKSLVTGVIQCIIYWISSQWRPQWIFSWKSFTSLFSFGSFMFLNDVVNCLFLNSLSLIIGKSFSATTLGYYTQARKLEDIPRVSLTSAINNVTFPVFSQIQDDTERLRNVSRKCLKSLAFVNFPLMMLLIVIAEPLFTLLFTNKWSQSVPYFQALCIYGLVTSLIDLNSNIIASIGKSKLSLIIRLAQRFIGILLIIIGLFWGIKGILLGYILSQYISFAIVTFITGKLIGYGIKKQCIDCFPMLFLSFITAIVVYFLCLINLNFIVLLCFQCLIYTTLYIFLSKLLKLDGFEILWRIIKTKRKDKELCS